MRRVFLVFLFVGILISGCAQEEFQLVPKEKVTGTATAGVSGTEVGTGWSAKENPAEAAEEAVNMALKEVDDKTPDLAVIFASSASDLNAIVSKARGMLGANTKMYGGTSDSRAVMTNKGFVKVSEHGYEFGMMGGKRGLAVMLISSEDITFGVGAADFSKASPKEASKAALLNAIKSAGKSENEMPDVVLVTPTKPDEDFAVEGIESVVGKETIILGGTAGGPEFGVIGKDAVYGTGVSLAVIYTDLPIGWVFEGGFDVRDTKSGTVTKIEGRNILEIDNRPALEVYNEWLDGEVDKLYEELQDPRVVKSLLTLHPLYRKYTAGDGTEHCLFSHPWPTDPTQQEKGVSTSTTIKEGDIVHLSHGTWETLLNRIGNLPKKARANTASGSIKPIFGMAYVCAGVMGTIPEEEREKITTLMNYENSNAHFLGTFTWGEQGLLPGVGNKHGNLLTGFLVIGEKE
ncbi:FIST C-terminal domain-containing protein [Candidatus Woesearchaeota archaeon]|nr:FIST C-terminal domain-containing protein [Candidatus Woesearchaeota archaeon]